MDTPMGQENSPSSPPGQYEFTSQQNAIIARLASDMVWVAVPLQLVGIIYGIALIICVVKAFRDPAFIAEAALLTLAMLFYLVLGIWTNKSADSFKRIVSTQGQDINYLMD